MKENNLSTLDRRSFLKTAGLLVGAFSTSKLDVFGSSTSVLQENCLFKCNPIVLSASPDIIDIMCITTKPTYCWLHYGAETNNLNMKTREVRDGMAHIGTVHHFKLKNLDAGKQYQYVIEAVEVQGMERKDSRFGQKESSNSYTVNTFSKNDPQLYFLVYNDMHETPESFGLLRNLAPSKQPDFYVLNGDMVSSMRSEDHFVNNVLVPMAEVSGSSVPIVYSRGNHETWSNHARQITDYLLDQEHPFYYGFRKGPAYILVLDSGESRKDSDPVNWGLTEFDEYRKEQGEWLKREVEKPEFKEAKHKIVITHIPAFYSKNPVHSADHYFSLWGDTLNKSGISLMICGHTHTPGIHPAQPGKIEFPVVIGGGPKQNKRTLISVIADENKLQLKLIHETGKLLGELTV